MVDQSTMNNVERLSLHDEIYLEVKRLTLFCMTHPCEEEQPQKVIRGGETVWFTLCNMFSQLYNKALKTEYHRDKCFIVVFFMFTINRVK